MCCSVLQCVAVCLALEKKIERRCSVLQRVAACCSVLQCVAVCCSVIRRRRWSGVEMCCNMMQYVAVRHAQEEEMG